MFKLLCVFVLLFAAVSATEQEVNFDLCPTCFQLISESIGELEKIIADGGVIGTCGELCGLLPSQWEQVACDLVCDYVGIEGFIYILNKVDPDAFLICEEFKLCKPHDGGAANITALAVMPTSGPIGTVFKIGAIFNILAETGPGEIVVEIFPPGGEPAGDGEFYEVLKVGPYQTGWELDTGKGEGTSTAFQPGTYPVEVALCYGECGSKHEHSGILATGKTSFTVTE